MTPAIVLTGLTRRYGAVRAVEDINLTIEPGEFFALLGPSGSGKTTCLRLIAGFEQPTAGSIAIFGAAAAGLPPYRRNVNTVFQDYALFPHLSVIDNVAFGLMIRGQTRRERHAAAAEALELVRLPGYGDRRPAQLSGGQRQRVALARALVNKPRVLLLDEPLGALDLKLREQMQEELKELQRALGITFLFVTHDQGEALSMADRLAVFNAGRIEQVGRPQEIYRQPRTRFVADFVGSSNLLAPALAVRFGGRAAWSSLRPEDLQIGEPGVAADPGRQGFITARVEAVSYLGGSTRLALSPTDVDLRGERRLHALLPSATALPAVGALVALACQPQHLHVLEETA